MKKLTLPIILGMIATILTILFKVGTWVDKKVERNPVVVSNTKDIESAEKDMTELRGYILELEDKLEKERKHLNRR